MYIVYLSIQVLNLYGKDPKTDGIMIFQEGMNYVLCMYQYSIHACNLLSYYHIRCAIFYHERKHI